MNGTASRIRPVLLSGGSGSRLWPLSRESYPKQFLPLSEEMTLLQRAALRTADPAQFAPLTVIANADHRFLIAEQIRAVDLDLPRIVLEPVGRNTAPAAAVAALLIHAQEPDALMLLMPADHVIGDTDAFLDAIERGRMAAKAGAFVLFGVQPDALATGYGYIKRGAVMAGIPDVHRVEAFVEKPDADTARRYLVSGDYLWNSGIFLLPVGPFLDELASLAPEVLEAARAAIGKAVTDMDFLRLDPDAFARSPSISLDYAVMEKTGRAAVVSAAMQWTDVGSWSALWDIGEKDAAGNVLAGDVVAQDARNSYLRSDGPLVAALGVNDLIVVATPDAVLVMRRDRDQEVKQLVDVLRNGGHALATQTPFVHRPWGYYMTIHAGERFQVKRITVKPGAKLSLQKHFHRAEHWVVVNGTALVTRNDEQLLLRENESVFLPLGCVHRLENPGRLPLNLIEVQSGAYLGEDDIVRFEDDYARD